MVDAAAARILVILATYNGSKTLPSVLAGYEGAKTPTRPWALIIVDNGSSDDTDAVVRSYESSLPLIVLQEPIAGKNRALNRALDFVGQKAELYVFTDDDAVPHPDFLVEWENVLTSRLGYELFGAVVEPFFSEPPPKWLSKYKHHFAEIYAENDRPEGEIVPSDIFGPNMAVRLTVLQRGHRFNEVIGPSSSQADYPMGSETEFCSRVAKTLDSPPWFASGPRVRHLVRPNQTTYEFVGRRAFRHGRGFALRQALETGIPPSKPLKMIVKKYMHRVAALFSISSSWWQYNWLSGYSSTLPAFHKELPSEGR